MKHKKIWITLFLLLGILIIGFISYTQYLARKSLPNYDDHVKLYGLRDKVVIYRDNFAIPHVYAKYDTDLYRAVGYCLAQDRLWQMDLLKRVTTGRLAEIFGKDFIEIDLLLRALKITKKSKFLLKQLNPSILESLTAFSDGINQYILHNHNKLPLEFQILDYDPEEWDPIFSLNLIGYMAWNLAFSWKTEIELNKILNKVGEKLFQDIVPDIHSYKPIIYPEFANNKLLSEIKFSLLEKSKILEEMGLIIFTGSNNWAVSGKKSITGKPILANDMHLDFSIPGIWYQIHQSVENGLDVSGVLLPGQPYIICGHNSDIAWGMTNVMVDDIDFYLEKINPNNPKEYIYNGKWKKMDVTKERIQIKAGSIIEKELRFTGHGPIISEFKNIKDKAISMRWIGNEQSNEIRTIHLLNRARNWDDFRNAIKSFISISQNIVYADIKGNIGMYCCAGIPIRTKKNGMGITPGWTSKYEWKGFVPFEKRPHVYNPPCNFVSSANNKTVTNDYPYHISHFFDLPYRIDRINELLALKERLSVSDFKEIQLDMKSNLVKIMLGDIVTILKAAKNLSSIETNALKLFEGWDMAFKTQSPAATIFDTFYINFGLNTFQDEMGKELYDGYRRLPIMQNFSINKIWKKKESNWLDDIRTKNKREKLKDIVVKSFKESIAWLNKKLGSNPNSWAWGKIHKLYLSHPLASIKILDLLFDLNKGPYPVGGSFHTVNNFGYPLNPEFNINIGASQRHIFDISNWDRSITVIPTGTSGIPASDYYCDQTKLYINGEYHNDFTSKNLIEKNAKYKMTLTAR